MRYSSSEATGTTTIAADELARIKLVVLIVLTIFGLAELSSTIDVVIIDRSTADTSALSQIGGCSGNVSRPSIRPPRDGSS